VTITFDLLTLGHKFRVWQPWLQCGHTNKHTTMTSLPMSQLHIAWVIITNNSQVLNNHHRLLQLCQCTLRN